jgi:Ca2+-binding RTX toxin-like protein
MDSMDVTHLAGCNCAACTGYGGDRGELFGQEGYSLDPSAGGSYAGKPIWDVSQIAGHLNRTGYDWYTNNYGELDDGVLNFGFWDTQAQLEQSYYVNDTNTIAFSEFFQFQAFTAGQRAVARESIALWDDLIDIQIRETKVGVADITYGNALAGAGVQAYAYLPFGDQYDAIYEAYYDWSEIGRLGGDVWIGGNVASNFTPLQNSYYSVATMIHETGHALGLSHPGAYNAGGGAVFSYANNAEYAQDSRQYSIMSYFDAYQTGANHIDWSLLNFAYGATPGVHDVAAIQAMYGADMDTRTGDTVYGFNSTADRAAFDFSQNTRPIVTIWDAGGTDTLDFSGWNTPSVIDLNEGAFSSGGGIEKFLTLEEVNANRAALGFAARSQATYDFYESLKAQMGITTGLFTDNISIAYGAVIENAIGGGGNDTITGNQVANLLVGGAGNDTINGGDGDDTIVGGVGQDIMDGGTGSDTVSYVGSSAKVTVNLANNYVTGGDAFKDKILNFENITGSSFDDTLSGNAGSNTINGGDGNDTISSANGDDTVNGDGGNDTIRGGGGNDTLNGGEGSDTLLGEAGNDTLDGGAGADTLTGGSNNDTFRFTVLDGSKDTITDFKTKIDKIDLSGLDAITGNANANDHFTWIGGAAFSGTAGELRTFLDGGVFSLGGDTDGDGLADFIVNLAGATTIAQTDIIFA